MQDARSNGPNAIMSRGLPDDWTDTSFDHVSHFPVAHPRACFRPRQDTGRQGRVSLALLICLS